MRVPTPVAQLVRGFAMGTADIVPGVSGGTVALVTGIYERLIRNVHAGAQVLKVLLQGRLDELGTRLRAVEWMWLVSLLVGILAAVAVLSSVLSRLLDEQPVRTSALFLGLVAGAIVVAWRMLGRLDAATVGVLAVSAVALFLVLGLRSATESDADKVVTQPLWVFFLAGAVAICAMILPGISGSLILVMLGMYSEVLGAVTERDLLALSATALGCIVGLMLGSMRVLWPWPGGTATTELARPSGDVVVPVVIALVGLAVVVAVERTAQRFTNDASREMPSSRSASPSANENRA